MYICMYIWCVVRVEYMYSKMILLSKGTYILEKLHPVEQLRTVLEQCRGIVGDAVEGFCHLFRVRIVIGLLHAYTCYMLGNDLILSTHVLYFKVNLSLLQAEQLCAMCLVLATQPDQQVNNRNIF